MNGTVTDKASSELDDFQEKLLRYSTEYRSHFGGEHTTGTLLALEARQVITKLRSELRTFHDAQSAPITAEPTVGPRHHDAETEGRKECAFEKWCDEVDSLARGVWPEQASYTADTGVDFWRAAFELGATPEAAWNDEVLAAQDM